MSDAEHAGASGFAGRFVWYELMTTDTAAARAFYGSVVGWRMHDAGMPGFEYTLLGTTAGDAGGLMEIPAEARAQGAQPGWIGYIAVDDVDAKTAAVAAAGGKVYREPADIPNVGRFSVVADPQGAVFSLFVSDGSGEMPDVPPGTPGHAGWRELHAGDWEQVFPFYAELFGWTKANAFDMGPMGTYQIFAVGDEPTGGMMTKPQGVPVPVWNFYFLVDGAEAALERVKAAGGQVLHGPVQVPGDSWIVQGLDPQGAFFSLISHTR